MERALDRVINVGCVLAEIGTVVRCSPLRARREASTVAERCAPYPRWKAVNGGVPATAAGLAALAWLKPRRCGDEGAGTDMGLVPTRGMVPQQEYLWHDASVLHTFFRLTMTRREASGSFP